MNDKTKLTLKNAHILLFILGCIFIFLGAFHENIWFDESYSVAISSHSFTEIWQIGASDVHPVLYYIFLKILSILFGNSIMIYRIFSTLGIAILALLGYTHIRKDFGEKVGILFTLLSFFLPVMVNFATEIRMYSWSITFVSLMAIYAYRLTKDQKTKNWVLFGICSIASCYMHYYCLIAAAFVNLFLLIFFLKRKNKKEIITFFITAAVQVICYIPWLLIFLSQFNRVSKGFWIGFSFPDTFLEIVNFQFKTKHAQNNYPGFIMAVALYIYIAFIIKKSSKKNKENWPAFVSLLIYIAVILLAWITSILTTPILYSRYLFTISGFIVFFIAFFMAKENNKNITMVICTILVIIGTMNSINIIDKTYDKTDMLPVEYLKENVKEGDILIYSDIISAGFIPAVHMQNNTQYFLNLENWGVEDAYAAYGPQMKIANSFDILSDYHGRIWLIDTSSKGLYEKLPKNNIKVLEEKSIYTKYDNRNLNFMLVEKE